MSASYADLRRLLAGERLPAALVDLDAFDRNADAFAQLALKARGSAARIRIAAKSLRVPALLSRLIERGAPYRGLMVASAPEAAFLAASGFDDLLVAYPTIQDSDLAALRRLHDAGTEVMLVADSVDGLDRLDAAMRGTARPFPVLLEVDVSLRPFGVRVGLGVLRSPVWDARGLLDLADVVRRRPGLRLKGLLTYEAFVAGVGDRNPYRGARNPLVRLLRGLDRRLVARKRRALAEALARAGVALEIFNGGGSASLAFAATEPWLTELTAGSAFLGPHSFDYFTNMNLEPAAFFALQAARRPAPDVVTCYGGGYVSSGDPGWERVPRPWRPEGGRLFRHEGTGEVQTPVRLAAGDEVALGDPVFFRHAKAGELAEHFNEYLLVSNGRITARVPTYRGLGQSFY